MTSDARTLSERLVDNIIEIFAAQQNNNYLILSDKISGQIPRSYAANAYRALCRSSMAFELMRTYTLWEVGENKISIPSLVDAIDIDGQIRNIRDRLGTLDSIFEIEFDDPELTEADKITLAGYRVPESDERRYDAIRRLRRIKSITNSIRSSHRLRNLANARHKNIAHSLIETRREAKGEQFEATTLRDARWLVCRAQMIVESIRSVVFGINFDWKLSTKYAEDHASYLYDGISISVVK